MNKAEAIDHLCLMIRSNVDGCRSSLLDEHFGYAFRLRQVAKDGGFATEATQEAMGLARAAEDLRRCAAELTEIREHLIRNSIERGA